MDLSKGSVTKNILKLSWPLMIGMAFQVLFNIFDAIYLGRYDTLAFSAVSLTFPVIFFIISIAGGLGVGATSVIARRMGAGQGVSKSAVHSLYLGLIMAAFFTSFGLIIAKPLFIFIGAGELMPYVLEYVGIIFSGSIFMFMAFMVNSIFRGIGEMKIPMLVMVVATILNIILDPIMIYGLLGVAELGVKGAAYATIISRCTAALIGFVLLFKRSNIKIKWVKVEFKIFKDILKVGLPASFQQSSVSLGIMLMTKIYATFGVYAIAAFGIIGRLDSFAVLPIIGINAALVTIVGYNVGAKKLDRAQKSFWRAAWLTFLFGSSVGVIYFIFALPIVNLFTNDPNVIAYSVDFLRVLALFSGYSSISIVVGGAFQGTGHGVPPLIITALRHVFLLLGFAWFFGIYLGYGLIWTWWAFPVSAVISSTIGMIWFKMGTWRKGCKKVDGLVICD